MLAPSASAAPTSIQADGALHLYYGFNLTNQCGAFSNNREGLNDYDCYWVAASLWNNHVRRRHGPVRGRLPLPPHRRSVGGNF